MLPLLKVLPKPPCHWPKLRSRRNSASWMKNASFAYSHRSGNRSDRPAKSRRKSATLSAVGDAVVTVGVFAANIEQALIACARSISPSEASSSARSASSDARRARIRLISISSSDFDHQPRFYSEHGGFTSSLVERAGDCYPKRNCGFLREPEPQGRSRTHPARSGCRTEDRP